MTKHLFINSSSDNVKQIPDKSVNLIVTSPPYPMVKMWDDIFASQDENIKAMLQTPNTDYIVYKIFSGMHKTLNKVWEECDRILHNDGIICINVGDAVRSFNDKFQLFPNREYIVQQFIDLGYHLLPDIIWHKPTNAPNKFMGSGTLPVNAYVTYEHEYILIFRKCNKRSFIDDENIRRAQSSFFYEERNQWFSDIWNINGTNQTEIKPSELRNRSGAYPLEIPYRLINMYSIQSDTVYDPFAGTCTTAEAAIISNRNSISVDIDNSLLEESMNRILSAKDKMNDKIDKRLNEHMGMLRNHSTRYKNKYYGFPVVTKEEENIFIPKVSNISRTENCLYAEYSDKAKLSGFNSLLYK